MKNFTIFLLILSILLVATPNMGHAQVVTSSPQTAIYIKINPQNPGPHQRVQAQVTTYSFEIQSASITWYINGKKVDSGLAKDTISFTTGDLGSETKLEVDAISSIGENYQNTLTIYATSIDLVWSTDSYTPAGYPGKALPTRGSQVKVVALPELYRANKFLNPKSLVYKWSVNDKLLKDSSGRGMDVLTTQLETSVDGDNTITVEITDDSQQVNQRKSIIITTHSPRLSFYELHPLEGPKYQRQVMDGYTIHPGITTQILAIPFFLNLNISKEFSYTWKVNSTLVPGNINPKILNFNTADGSLGDAIIDLTMQSPRSIFEQAQHTTTIHVQ